MRFYTNSSYIKFINDSLAKFGITPYKLWIERIKSFRQFQTILRINGFELVLNVKEKYGMYSMTIMNLKFLSSYESCKYILNNLNINKKRDFWEEEYCDIDLNQTPLFSEINLENIKIKYLVDSLGTGKYKEVESNEISIYVYKSYFSTKLLVNNKRAYIRLENIKSLEDVIKISQQITTNLITYFLEHTAYNENNYSDGLDEIEVE